MNQPQRSRPNRRRNPQKPTNRQAGDLWRSTPELDVPDPIRPTSDPSALIESLGPPPLQYQSDLAGQYFAAVIERAATVATALAASAGLLADVPED